MCAGATGRYCPPLTPPTPDTPPTPSVKTNSMKFGQPPGLPNTLLSLDVNSGAKVGDILPQERVDKTHAHPSLGRKQETCLATFCSTSLGTTVTLDQVKGMNLACTIHSIRFSWISLVF